MEKKDLYRPDFKKELIEVAVSCIGLKPSTVKKKVSNIFEHYKSLMAYRSSHIDYYEEKYHEIKVMFDTIKSGVIDYKRGDANGKILLKDIVQVEVREKDVLLITKTGREIKMGKDFSYLNKLL